MDDVFNQAVTAAVIVAFGAGLWSLKPFWAKGLALLCFASAIAVVYETPVLAAVLGALIIAFFAFKGWRKAKKASKKREEKEKQSQGVTVHVHNH